jgi:hypothetical protein
MPILPRRRRGYRAPRDLHGYRKDLDERTNKIDLEIAVLVDLVDALRRRASDVDEAIARLEEGEDRLDAAAAEMREMVAPEELHALHSEYEANLERSLRGIVTAERGCGITRQPHRPPDDEEPMIYWKRGHLNMLHALMRMRELVAVMLAWEPGRPAEATVTARVRRI